MSAFSWNWPNVTDWLNANVFGWATEIAGPGFSIASNVVVGTNPPFTVSQFLSIYPNFGGAPLVLTGTITQGSAVVTGLQTTAGILPEQSLASAIPLGSNQFNPSPFPDGTTVQSVDSANQLTLSQAASTTGGQIAVYNAAFVPLAAMTLFIMLASSQLVYNRWKAQWFQAMCLFVAHECTLYLRTNGYVPINAQQLAAAGLAGGIKVSKSAGGVSVGIQPATQGSDLANWGDLQETEYGVKLARLAKIIGGGPMWLY